jgi:hypothetical protein
MAEGFRCAELILLAGNEGITRSAAGIANTTGFGCEKSPSRGRIPAVALKTEILMKDILSLDGKLKYTLLAKTNFYIFDIYR